MITGKTSSGFSFEISENTLDNMEFVDTLAEATDDNLLSVSRVVEMMLGKTQRKRLYDHVRTEDGRVPVAAVSAEIVEIFQAFSDSRQGKN